MPPSPAPPASFIRRRRATASSSDCRGSEVLLRRVVIRPSAGLPPGGGGAAVPLPTRGTRATAAPLCDGHGNPLYLGGGHGVAAAVAARSIALSKPLGCSGVDDGALQMALDLTTRNPLGHRASMCIRNGRDDSGSAAARVPGSGGGGRARCVRSCNQPTRNACASPVHSSRAYTTCMHAVSTCMHAAALHCRPPVTASRTGQTDRATDVFERYCITATTHPLAAGPNDDLPVSASSVRRGGATSGDDGCGRNVALQAVARRGRRALQDGGGWILPSSCHGRRGPAGVPRLRHLNLQTTACICRLTLWRLDSR